MAPADGRQRVLLRRRASKPVARVESRDEDAEECAYLMIRPDPRCPECNTIMDWRSAHRWIAIPNGAEIKLSDRPLGIRHLHVQVLRTARQKNRVARQAEEWARNERFHPLT